MTKLECIWPRQSLLGEGARYDPTAHALWWVDILGQRIMRLSLDTGQRTEWSAPTSVGTTFAAEDGGVLALLRHSIERLDPDTGAFTPLVSFPGEPSANRFNDGAVGPDGALWVASMDFDCKQPTGRLYALDPGGCVTLKDDGYIVANGPVISADGLRLFVCETMRGLIYCFDRDPETNALSNKRVFAEIVPQDGLPDGLCADSEGGLWVALVTGGKIRRFTATGALDFDLHAPSPIVTSVTIGGKDRRTLFVTTGRILLSETELDAHPASGSLFQARVDFEGLICPAARVVAQQPWAASP